MKKQMYVAPKAEVIELNVNKDFMQKVPGNDGGTFNTSSTDLTPIQS